MPKEPLVASDSQAGAFALCCGGDLIAVLRRCQGEVLALCDMLEEIADSLPDKLDARRCRLAATTIEPVIRDIHRFEEMVVFPVVCRQLERYGASSRCIERLKAEHLEDQSFAGEVAYSLNRMIADPRVLHADMMGYMLRGFFESVRRHIAFERDYLLVLISPI